MKKKYFKASLIYIFVLAFAAIGIGLKTYEAVVATEPVTDPGQVLIIDPGHGGWDGGAVSLSGAKESDINLAISLKLDALAGLYGIPVVLTRDEDDTVADDPDAVAEDLKARMNFVNSYANALLISIHQNSFTESKYHGAQVFYGSWENSGEFAQLTQNLLRESLNPQNMRETKYAGTSIYLLENSKCPSILVECGFLTNPEEDLLLQDSDYQTKIAAALTKSVIDFRAE